MRRVRNLMASGLMRAVLVTVLGTVLAGCATAYAGAEAGSAVDLPPQVSVSSVKAPIVLNRTEGADYPEIWTDQPPQGRTVRNVTQSTLTPVLPAADKATGAAVIIAPGGGMLSLAVDKEGLWVAQWFADRGVAAFVLTYRLEPTEPDIKTFGTTMWNRLQWARSAQARQNPPAYPETMALAQAVALEDVRSALSYLHDQAGHYGVDPARIGMIGFSAGSRLTLEMSLSDAPLKPAFVGLIYGPMSERDIPADAPPAFMVYASDDALVGLETGLWKAWRVKKIPAELHIYEKGNHGFGLGTAGTTTTGWSEQFYAWLKARRIIP